MILAVLAAAAVVASSGTGPACNDARVMAYSEGVGFQCIPNPDQVVYSLRYKMCATDKYTDGKLRTWCDWDVAQSPWVYVYRALCDSEGTRELSVNYGDWRTIEHLRLRATEYQCTGLSVLKPADVSH